jgi:predicted esterase
MIRTHHLTVPRTARYATLGAPDIASDLWLVCHGYGQLAGGFLEGMRAIEAPQRLVVAPEGLSRFYLDDESGPHGPQSRVGATWMTREDRENEIEDYVTYLEQLHQQVREQLPGAPERAVALGFSQGVATAARWAARTRSALDELVLWGARLPPELDPGMLGARAHELRVTLVVGSRDRFLTVGALREEEDRLAGCGVRVRALTFEGGHRLDDATLRMIAGADAPPVAR